MVKWMSCVAAYRTLEAVVTISRLLEATGTECTRADIFPIHADIFPIRADIFSIRADIFSIRADIFQMSG